MFNKAILIGRVGQDPEVRYAPDGTAFANCSLATSESWKDKKSGEKKELTQWHRLVFFEKKAEVVRDFVKKGDLLQVEGKIKYRSWEKQDGTKAYTTEIQVTNLIMLGGKKDASQSQGSQYGNGQGASAKHTEPSEQQNIDDEGLNQLTGDDFQDGDIPF